MPVNLPVSLKLDQLNSSQSAAVETLDGPLLVLAGAGSGKTRILTYRIAHLIYSGTALPGEIFAVTFTNKAAREMLHRVMGLISPLGISAQDLWISTFHSSGAKILRQYGHYLGLEPGFTILDDGDQLTLIKQCMANLNLSDKVLAPKAIQHRINQLKNEAIDPKVFEPSARSFSERMMLPLLRAYEDGLKRNNSVDFGDLLLKTFQLFRDVPSVRDAFQDRYRFLLVDEYQDTNAVQYEFLKILASRYRNICVVGDEDQCIYRWRGADIRNILDFEKDYPDAKVVKLEENYRSTGHIIRAANGVIAHNTQRKEKELFTSNPDGDPVEIHILESDFEESRWVSRRITECLSAGRTPREIAIFYRTNAQSRLIEDNLRIARTPYRVFGGLKFYDRAEIKDALAYLRLFANPRDDLSLARIVNVPARGIGKSSVDAVRKFGLSEGCSLLEALGRASRSDGADLGAGPRKKIAGFLEIYSKLLEASSKMSPREFLPFVLEETGYRKSLQDETTIEAQSRLENLEELGNALSEYETRSPEPTLAGFLEEIALVTDVDKANSDEESVTLMTLHSAKGLEYPVVFVVGCEEELFPSARALADADESSIEEERRLCYVGMTRAREQLFLVASQMRRVFGVTHVRKHSRFLDEVPEGECRWEEHRSSAFGQARSRPRFDSEFGDAFVDPAQSGSGDFFEGSFERAADDGMPTGARVRHPDFGEGKILRREGSGSSLKLSVAFERFGTKKFLAKFAPLERL